MARYILYKNSKIINIAECDEVFINTLIMKGEIDNAIISNPTDQAFKYDENTKSFVNSLPIIPPAPTYKELREAEYPPIQDVVVALIEKEEGRPEALETIKQIRQTVKIKYPKPNLVSK